MRSARVDAVFRGQAQPRYGRRSRNRRVAKPQITNPNELKIPPPSPVLTGHGLWRAFGTPTPMERLDSRRRVPGGVRGCDVQKKSRTCKSGFWSKVERASPRFGRRSNERVRGFVERTGPNFGPTNNRLASCEFCTPPSAGQCHFACRRWRTGGAARSDQRLPQTSRASR